MSDKSYLKNQIRLVSLNANDLFTDQEHEIFMNVCDLVHEIEKLEEEKDPETNLRRKELIAERKRCSALLTQEIKQHSGIPRKVRLKSVLSQKKDQPSNLGATWKELKFSKKITEFESEMSRSMGLSHLDYTFDKIIIKWKNEDVLQQLVNDGFTFDLLKKDGTIETKKYRCFTASAGQLRRDKIQFISEDMWKKIKPRLECGLDWDRLNEEGGVNITKYMAYMALNCSATDEWTDFDIDRVIVVPDWEGEVTDEMLYIKPDYTTERGVRTVTINHMDGAGMMLPNVSKRNFMFRMAYCKGLLGVFDFIRFCEKNGVEPVVEDIWGMKHDLKKENIQILLTKSQFKMWKYYRSWDEYKEAFKKNGCKCGKTNYEEDYLPDKQINYQMLQTLVDFSDEEIQKFTAREHNRIVGIAKDKTAMLQTLKASSASPNPYCRALMIYPELLRDYYSRQQLKDIKKKLLYDAKSGAIRCENKRLFVVPDFYAACEHYFLHKERSDGLLKNGEIACRHYRHRGKADVLRSPHLFLEHAIRKIVDDPKVYEWFTTDAVVTSCHDLISRILQFDVDGDQLNVVVEPVIVEAAERNVKNLNIVPLFYDANKADPEIVSKEALFKGLKRAHDYSNIGEISNMLTRLWNRNSPDVHAAALLAYVNNLRIDAAKTGMINEYINYPEIAKQINKATGGKNGKMPYFFQYSKNGRSADKTGKKNYAKSNNSTMNRICAAFDNIGNINMNMAGIPPFNYQMLMSAPFTERNTEIVQTFCDLDGMSVSTEIALAETPSHERSALGMYEMLAEVIKETLEEKFGSLETCYPYIVKALFAGENWKKPSHKKMFWRVFGEIALRNLQNNLANYSVCPKCDAKIPAWAKNHTCPKNEQGFFICEDCGVQCIRTGSRKCRCDECQKTHRDETKKLSALRRKDKKRGYDFCFTSLQSFLNKTSKTEPSGQPMFFANPGQQMKPEADGE